MSIDAAVTGTIVALQTAVANAGTLQNASQLTLAPVVTAVTTALAAIDAQCDAIEPTIDETSVGGIHVGTPAPQLITILLAQTQAVTDLSTLKTLRGYVARIGINVNPPSPTSSSLFVPLPPPRAQQDAQPLGMP